MFRPFSTRLAFLTSLLLPVAHAALIEDLASLKFALDSLCGPRFDVIMLDETQQTPPCMMSYSPRCTELQYHGPASCEVVMRFSEDDDAQLSVSNY
ncbi:hypothetical protein [Andreprevotia chitinilytica]|uniref:hypothetical protein n=1 Tax=Andreprevotia chitinilytica TaxID=396808 RepID=UPI0005567990|nr:hypothetical protein [Andreprevotia chitinilytica]